MIYWLEMYVKFEISYVFVIPQKYEMPIDAATQREIDLGDYVISVNN